MLRVVSRAQGRLFLGTVPRSFSSLPAEVEEVSWVQGCRGTTDWRAEIGAVRDAACLADRTNCVPDIHWGVQWSPAAAGLLGRRVVVEQRRRRQLAPEGQSLQAASG